jgi:hypothetical protein
MPSVNQINESTNPECFYLEDVELAGTYSIPSRDIDWINGAIRSVVKKCYDGVMIFAMMEDHIEVYWRRDLDQNPIKVSEMWLYGSVYYNDQWNQHTFNFDVTNQNVDLTVITQGEKYWVLWTVDAYGGTNYMGLEWTFTKGTADTKFFLFSPNNEVEIKLHVDVRNAELKDNRADGKGLDAPIEADTTYEDTPSTGWTRYEYIYTRDGACEAAEGRTAVQLFAQDAGISVR